MPPKGERKEERKSALIAVIDSLPGAGKSYLCEELQKMGYVTADLDDFTQGLLQESTAETCGEFKSEVAGQIKQKIATFLRKQSKPVVLCGVSRVLFDSDCAESVVTCGGGGCRKFWIDLATNKKTGKGELEEAVRRAVVREFRVPEVSAWRDMSAKDRAADAFYRLDPPEKLGEGLGAAEAWKLVTDLSVVQFRKAYRPWFDAMLHEFKADGLDQNRADAIARGFVPARPEEILRALAK